MHYTFRKINASRAVRHTSFFFHNDTKTNYKKEFSNTIYRVFEHLKLLVAIELVGKKDDLYDPFPT